MSESFSAELMPMTSYRDDWNRAHGTNLEAHNSLLTADQAEQINQQFDIEVVLGVHGNPNILPAKSTQVEYEEVASLVDRLHPGDTLFIEGAGFTEQPKEPIDWDSLGTPTGMMGDYLFESLKAMYELSKQLQAAELEKLRNASKIDAWDYARQLAMLKGIRVVNADYDAFEVETTLALSGHQSIEQILFGTSERDRIICDEIIVRQRSLKAVNILKDDALTHPVAVQSGRRKPRLMLLIGDGHSKLVTEALNNMYLDAQITQLRKSSQEERVYEHVIAPVLGGLATTMGLRAARGPLSSMQQLGITGAPLGAKTSDHLREFRRARQGFRRDPASNLRNRSQNPTDL